MPVSESTFTLEELRDILVSLIGLGPLVPVDDPETTYEELGIDSLGFLEVQVELQQRFGVEIPEEDAAKIHTLGATVEYVNRRLGERS
jgi:acyl carrier protein